MQFLQTASTNTKPPYEFSAYQETLKREPDIIGKNVRVWTIRQTDIIRVNLVEFTGELKLHKHPDADHSLIVLDGSVRVQVGSDTFTAYTGDFVSVPADIPHKYWTIGPRAMLVSMDAPYYDPKKTISLE